MRLPSTAMAPSSATTELIDPRGAPSHGPIAGAVLASWAAAGATRPTTTTIRLHEIAVKLVARPVRICCESPLSLGTINSSLDSVTSSRAIASLPSGTCGFLADC